MRIPQRYRPHLQKSQESIAMADGQSPLQTYGKVSMPVRVHGSSFTFDMIVADLNQMDGIWGMDFMVKFKCDLKFSSSTYTFMGAEYPILPDKHSVLSHSVNLLKPVTIPAGREVIISGNLRSPFRTKQEAMLEASPYFVENYGVLPAKTVAFQSKRRRSTPLQLFNPTEEDITLPKGVTVGYMFPIGKVTEVTEESHDSLTVNLLDHVQTSCSMDCSAVRQLVDIESNIPSHLKELYDRDSEKLTEDQRLRLASVLVRYSHVFSKSSTDLGCTDKIAHTINTGDAKPFRIPLRRHGFKKEQEIRTAVQDGLSRGIMEESNSPWASPPVVVSKKDGTARFCIDFRKLNSITKTDSYPLPRFDECMDSLHGSQFFCSLDLMSGYWQVPLQTPEDREKTAFLTKDGLFQFRVLPFGLVNAPATFERLMECVLRGLQWERCLLYLDDILIFGRTFEETVKNLEKVLDRLDKANLKIKPSKCVLMTDELEFLGHLISRNGMKPLADKVCAVQNWPSPSTVSPSKLVTEVKRFLGLVSYYRRFIRNMSAIAAPLYDLTKKGSSLVWTDHCEAAFIRLKAALTSAPVLSFPDPTGGNFILDTDASNTGVGGVLSQVQDGRETVIGYYSQLLSDSERKYCITRREFLGVVKAVKHFKPYLNGHRFLIRTDNAAVSHMLSLTDTHEQIQRWQLFMSQFAFDVVHRPGRNHGNADAMSRSPCEQCGRTESTCMSAGLNGGKPRKLRSKKPSDVEPCVHTKETDDCIDGNVDELMMSCAAVTTRLQAKKVSIKPDVQVDPAMKEPKPPTPAYNGLVDFDTLSNLQLSDPDIAPILQLKLDASEYPDYKVVSAESLSVKALRQHWRHLFVDKGVLCRKLEVPGKDVRVQVILPRTLRDNIMTQLHCAATSGHLGTMKTLERIKQRFYWVGWRKDVTRFVSHCEACNVVKRAHKRNFVPLTQQLFGEAFERVSIDIIGPLSATSRGYRYVLTMEDNFTKWVEAAPLKTLETQEVCDALVRELVSRFGCMYIIHSDRGAQFTSRLYQSLLEKLGVDRSLTTAYNPKSNGLVEGFNKVLKTIMKTYVFDHKESVGTWDVMLPIFLMAYRSSVHGSTGETPHFLLTSREMKLPIDLLYSCPSDKETNVPDYVRQLEVRFNKAYAIVRNQLQLAQRVQKRQYETRHPKYQSLQSGMFAWYFNPRKSFKGGKQPSWLGPYLVKEVNDDFTVLIQTDNAGTTKRTHADKLRVAHGFSMDEFIKRGEQ